jgi:glycosyltransferase involved in cell wall biosynthesis
VVHELRRRAAAAGREDLLELGGFVERQRLPEEFSRADVFAAPSRYEGGPGFVYLEAMACGLPVIACSGSGAAEVVVPGENGLLVPPDDVGSLASALRQLLNDHAELGRRARAFALTHADAERCLDRLEGFYRRVVDRSKGGGR